MQNMNYYYDFSGQKFNHPLSLSINSFDRKVFSRQTSLELSYVLKGSYEVITEHISHSLTEQELAVIAPDEIHILKKLQPESVILTIHIDFERIPENMLGSCKNLFHTILCTPVSNASLLRSLKEEIRRLLMVLFNGDSADGTDLFALNEIMMKILCIAKKQRNTPFEQLPVDSTHHENYVRAIQFIDRHYQEDIHLTDIAKTLSFSTSYTSRLFTRYTGLSFVKYLSYVRVRESLEDLLEGKASIEEISGKCGMPNSKAYSQIFKELYGITPSTYRKRFVKICFLFRSRKHVRWNSHRNKKNCLQRSFIWMIQTVFSFTQRGFKSCQMAIHSFVHFLMPVKKNCFSLRKRTILF